MQTLSWDAGGDLTDEHRDRSERRKLDPRDYHFGIMSGPRKHSAPAGFLTFVVVLMLAGSAPAGTPMTGSPGQLTAAQIVDQMQRHNAQRAGELKHYTSLRHYEVQYKGFAATIDAKMEVEADYDLVLGKSFRIVSASGSGLMVNRVLKRLLQTEKEASKDQEATALTPANYRFNLEGMESVSGRPSYVLAVEPLTRNKLLYRGKVWVDAADFAVARIEAQPARNPSFWIAGTSIHHQYAKTDGFWLPERNRSESKIRLGGTAVLTIDYGAYQLEAVTPLAGGRL